LWRKKKEGENFEEEQEGMRGGRRKKEIRAPLALDPGSAAGQAQCLWTCIQAQIPVCVIQP